MLDQDKIIKSILNHSNFKIGEVTNIEIIKSLPSYHKYKDAISKILIHGQYEELNRMVDNSKSEDDITVIRFKADEDKGYYGIVYDSWELWQDPVVTEIYPNVPTRI